MKLEKNFSAMRNVPKNKNEQPESSLTIDLMEDDKFVSKAEKDLLQAEDSLELEKVRASLAESNNKNSELVTEPIKEETIILKPKAEQPDQEHKSSLLQSLAKNPRVAKILTGLGLFSVTHNEIQANMSKNSDLNKSESHNINTNIKTFAEEANSPDAIRVNNRLEPDPEREKRDSVLNENVKVNNEELRKKAEELVRENPGSFLEDLGTYKNVEGVNLKESIVYIRKNNPEVFLDKITFLQNENIPELNIDSEITEISNNDQKIYEKFVGKILGVNSENLAANISKFSTKQPIHYINEIPYIKNIKGVNVNNDLQKIKRERPYDLLECINGMDGIKGFNALQAVQEIREKDPEAFIEKIFDINLEGFDIVKEAQLIRKNNPEVFLYQLNNLKGVSGLNLESEVRSIIKNNPDVFLSRVGTLGADFRDAELKMNVYQEVEKLKKNAPIEFIANKGNFKNLRDFNFEEEIKSITAEDLALDADKNPESLLNNTDILKGNPNLKILNDKIGPALDNCIEKIKDPNVINKKRIEAGLKNYSLREIQKINALHESPNPIRFASVANDKPKELYTKMVYGEEEVFTTTFNGMFNILKSQLDKKKGGITGRELLDQVGDNKFRTFVKECAGFNRLDEFLATMDKADADKLLTDVVKDIDKTENKVSQAVTVADVFGNTGDPGTLKILQEQVKSEYERVSNDSTAGSPENKVMYGLLSSMFKDSALNEKEWFAGVSKEYPIEKVAGIKSQDLFNENGVCVQRYRFYEGGDKDGINSYNNFLDTYKKQPSLWNIDTSHKEFVVITSKGGDKKIQIFANVPQSDIEGVAGLEEMDQFMADNKLESIWDVYRGHSYGDVIPSNDVKNLKFFAAGSCGGANRIEDILDVAPQAHIMSTEGTGSRYVNDPILNHINKIILSGKDLNWQEAWDSLPASVKNNENFKNYIAPHKNQGVMFLKSYNALVYKQ